MTNSQKPTIAVTRRFSEEVEQRLESAFRVKRFEDDRQLDGPGVAALCDGADGLLCCSTERIDKALIESLPSSVKIVASYSVGFDHIDISAAKRRGLCITNTPDVLTDATAEIAVLLMLAASRRARESQHLIESGKWGRWSPTLLLGMQLSAARIGFVGMGRIARRTVSMVRPFDAKMRYWNRRRYDAETAGADVEFVADLNALFATSDIVSIHVPGGADTTGLVNAERLALMPKGGIIVNTARGSVVDDDALIAALKSGHLGGAGLDVFDGEPAFDQRYRDLPNVFMLPHIGSATTTARNGMGFRAADNLEAFLAGREPPDRVV